MSVEKGSLSIHSENIFPIIKKWLYSDHDIFVRELISNATDAMTKLKRLDSMGEYSLKEGHDFRIDVLLDSKNKTITIRDTGLGLDEEEVKKYINQIAFSGAEDFLHKYKDKDNTEQIIGHFGLGFYSAFMVATDVEIHSLSYKEAAKPIHWKCDGGTEFELEEGSKDTIGTDIILHIGDDGTDFLNLWTLRTTIEKYCAFMPYPIFLTDIHAEPEKDEEGNIVVKEEKALNNTTPLYTKKPSECTDEEYKEFYRKTFHDYKEPLFYIHLNMELPFRLKGILYFPRLGNEFDNMEGQIKLFNSQVFIADNIKEVIPEFLLLLKGVIDCPDLPLNVSRSFLQNDGFVKKISDHISKKVADKLNSLYKKEKESYEKYWSDIHPFIKFGCLRDDKFYEKVKDILLFKNLSGNFTTLPEYLEANKEKHENKVYYVTDEVIQGQYVNMFKAHGMDAVILTHNIDQPFVSHMEMKNTDVKFARIDADLTDTLKDTDAHSEEEAKELAEKLTETFKKALNNENLKVQVEALKSEEISAIILLAEESRRMQDMSRMYGMMGMDLGSMMGSDETLVLNKKNKLVQFILNNKDDEAKAADVNLFCEQLYDLALLSHKPLEAEKMTQFIKRSNEILGKLI